jgi:hypothetical protein
MLEPFWLNLYGGERFEKIAKLNRIITVILNAGALRCSQNCASPVEFRCVKAHAHVGDKSAEHEYQVSGLDVLPNVFIAAHRAAVHAKVKRMVFGNRAFAQKIGGDGNVHSLRHSDD